MQRRRVVDPVGVRHRLGPQEAARLAVLAQEAVDQRWQVYEEMATRGPERFPADARAILANE